MAALALIGAGPMAIEYARVLLAQKIPFVVIGRGIKSASAFQQATGQPVFSGGFEKGIGRHNIKRAIIAVGEADLGKVARQVIRSGIKELLVEKPGGFDAADIRSLARLAKSAKAKVYVAYNRRFYASVKKAREIIRRDGGVLSFNFEFTEWGHVIKNLKKAPGVKKQWMLSNSTHVVDLAFFLGGKPKSLTSFAAKKLPWGPRRGIFAGAGQTKGGALFSYHANWVAPGRWGVEILTKNHRLIFRPLERLALQKIGELSATELNLEDDWDRKFKPGLYRQVQAFLGKKQNLPRLEEIIAMLPFYQKINGGQL